jgi:ribosomal protein S18 acetylase RimI-like enzyme
MDARSGIRSVQVADLDDFFAYLEDQLKDNGKNGVPLFHPYSRHTPWHASEKAELFRAGMASPVGAPGWRRAWAAFDERDAPIGHVDLRAHSEPSTTHRSLLGMGVHRDHRRRGIGQALIEHAVAWAVRETELEWIDLSVLGGNAEAERLYQRGGFRRVATLVDKFRIDGESVDDVLMTRRIRP